MVILTAEKLKQICPTLPDGKARAYLPLLKLACREYDIDTPPRLASFLAQIIHESGEFRWFQEIWGPTSAQKRYEPPSDKARDLGNTQPGDGQRFKGRGVIQLTGRDNYKKYGDKLGLDLISEPELAAEPINAFRLAGAFWQEHGLNALADSGDFKAITKKINGGLNGLSSRKKYFDRACQILGVPAETPKPITV